MTSPLEIVLIGGLVRALRAHGSWGGETHIQKAAYLAKHLRSVPFESEFVLYKHGPYSFDLNKSLAHLRSRGLLATMPREGYGPSYQLNFKMWGALNKGWGDLFGDYSAAMDGIAAVVGSKNVAELERLATAVYIDLNSAAGSINDKVAELVKAKPHIAPEVARKAFEEAAALAA